MPGSPGQSDCQAGVLKQGYIVIVPKVLTVAPFSVILLVAILSVLKIEQRRENSHEKIRLCEGFNYGAEH